MKKQSAQGSTTKDRLTFKQTVTLLLIAGFGLFAISGYYWYKSVLTDPERVLDGMLNKSLQTTSVYRTVEQESGFSSVDQQVFVNFTPQLVSKSVTQLNERSDAGQTTVTTETIGTPQTDYVRYTDIDVENAPNQGDFQDVLNVWAKRQDTTGRGEETSFLNDALFVVVPFGNLTASQREQVINEIDRVELYKTLDSRTEFKNGRPVITYTLNFSPQALVQVLAKYVEVTGIGSAVALDPAAYEGAGSLEVVMEVDVLSRHLNSVALPTTGRTEHYRVYNGDERVELPEETISINELQSRLQTVEPTQ